MRTGSFLIIFNLLAVIGFAQQKTNDEIKSMIATFKTEPRGPYLDIRWFCPDGTNLGPQERCPQPGGVQHARYRESVRSLAKSNHIFLGQILTGTDHAEFWDKTSNNSRIKQYQIEKYLQRVDDGWIQRKSQYYRGAVQAEDEQAWSDEFYQWLLSDNEEVRKHFYLVRQTLVDMPRRGDDSKSQSIRAQSKTLSEEVSSFMNLRIKIHSQPDAGDIESVKAYVERNRSKLSGAQLKRFETLISDMTIFYQPFDLTLLKNQTALLSPESKLKGALNQFIDRFGDKPATLQKLTLCATMMWRVRLAIEREQTITAKMALFEISLKLEELMFKDALKIEVDKLGPQMRKIHALALAYAASGNLEDWEWRAVSDRLKLADSGQVELQQLNTFLVASRSVVEWGAGMTRATYGDVVELYGAFEPLTHGFIDDRIRSSIGLLLGEAVGKLSDVMARESSMSNSVLDIPNQSHLHGLNPGYALGELVIVEGGADEVQVSADKIYIFNHPPSDLKPVAGILTVSEGNLVSHLQLLARNLGIPNAVLSDVNVSDLKKYAGQKVFFAVSNSGTVIMKTESNLSAEELKLFEVKSRINERITVPVEMIQLDQLNILNLRDVKSKDSGKSCGPKAANLGQLKQGFPDNVVEGLVIPFGIFKAHMDQPMPSAGMTYWEFLNLVFKSGREKRANGESEESVEAFELAQLEILRNAIKSMPLMAWFETQLNEQFVQVFQAKMGEVPVFLRSDTNMEDLKDFTGAGLNLTVFNVTESAKILQGIKDVWASPYTERSYKWRQKYLLNPENVYPSILIIPSVDVDYSGVLITKGVSNGVKDDLTVAFSRGAGGAVDGQAAETRIITSEGEILTSPAREPEFNRLPVTGGTAKQFATFERPILSQQNIIAIRDVSKTLRETLPNTPGIGSAEPYDVELGFQNDKLWLFQVRPFVENKRALGSTYLESITPKIDESKIISLNTPL